MINAKQSELAKVAGVSLATLNNIERGVADPRASTLEAIERALFVAGVVCDTDGAELAVRLSAQSRPSARETLHVSQRVLELLDRGSLLKPIRILFYAHRAGSTMIGGARTVPDDDRIVLGILIEGAYRIVLFDQVALSIDTSPRLAEAAGIMLGALALHGDRLAYVPEVLDGTTVLPVADAVSRLSRAPSEHLDHPAALFDLLGGWEACVKRCGTQYGHPMRDLLGYLGEGSEAGARIDLAEAEDQPTTA